MISITKIKGKWLLLPVSLMIVLLANGTGVTRSYFIDLQSSAGNIFEAYNCTKWTQTTQAEFEAGVLNQVDTSLCSGDVRLAEEVPQDLQTIASDDFESGGWAGGSGWLWEWQHEGDSAVTTGGTSHNGSYHLMLRASDGYVDRAADLSGCSDVHLQFWAKAASFEAGEFIECYVNDGVDSYVVHTWVDGDDDNTYRFYDIDLSSYNMASEFSIAFDAEMSDTDDYFYVDDLELGEQVAPADYFSSGTIASQVFDSGVSGTIWNSLFWDETLQSNTDITFEVRASDTFFLKDAAAPSWTSVGGTSPIASGLPAGRYMQWRATLTTSDTSETPILHEVRLYFY